MKKKIGIIIVAILCIVLICVGFYFLMKAENAVCAS